MNEAPSSSPDRASPTPSPPATPTHCDLCGLRLPPRAPETDWEGRRYRFCCLGCRHVFLILAESGAIEGDFKETDLYRRCLALGIIGNPQGVSDEPRLSPEELKDAREIVLHVDGMWCSACSWLIEKVVGSDEGVLEARVNFASDTAKVHYLPQKTGPERIARAIEGVGYRTVSRDRLEETATAERNSLLARTGIALFLLMNIMFFSYVLYVGYFQELSAEIKAAVPYILLGLSAPSVFWCGIPIHRKAWKSLRAGAPTMEVLLTISILSAFFYSLYALARGMDHFYFDTAAALVALLLVGKLVEHSAKQRASENIHRLYRMLPRKVRMLSGGDQRLVAIEQLQPGDVFVVRPGEKIPTDGKVVSGSTTVDESLLTGESRPVRKSEGEAVTGSSMNLGGVIEVKATRVGEDTLLHGIIRMVEDALGRRSPLERTVDRVARYFVPAVIALAAATGLVLLARGAMVETALLRSITVLVIACPCALGLATPLAVAAGVGYAAGRGILIRDGSVLQKAARVDTVIFDKTGTLTEGRFTLLRMWGAHDPEDATLRLLASVEQYANHPIGDALVAACREKGGTPEEAREVAVAAASGIEGRVGAGDGVRVVLGTEPFVAERGFSFTAESRERAGREAARGHTVVFFGIEESAGAGCLVLGDGLQASAPAAAEELRLRGLSLRVVSGDTRTTTAAIAGMAGISDFRAGASPADKIEEIESLQRTGATVAMVGDGVNDAPALAQADVGIAMGGGTEIARESSSLSLLREDLTLVGEAIDIAGRTVRTIHQNLAWAFVYNAAGILLAISGWLNPLVAAAAMLVSSLSVVANSLRLKEGKGMMGKRLVEFFFPWIEPAAKT